MQTSSNLYIGNQKTTTLHQLPPMVCSDLIRSSDVPGSVTETYPGMNKSNSWRSQPRRPFRVRLSRQFFQTHVMTKLALPAKQDFNFVDLSVRRIRVCMRKVTVKLWRF